MDQADKSSGQGAAETVTENAADNSIAAESPSIRLAIKLSPAQRIAVEAMGRNCSVPEAARRANVDRTTVSRWLHHDATFIAVHNELILDNIKASRAEMAALLPLAIAALRKALKKGNGWLALQFCREAQSLGVLEVGPTTPKAVKEDLKLAKQAHEAAAAKQQLLVRQQQEEIDKLKAQVEQYESGKLKESQESDEFWRAFSSFQSLWKRETEEIEREAGELRAEYDTRNPKTQTEQKRERDTLEIGSYIRQKISNAMYARWAHLDHEDHLRDKQVIERNKQNRAEDQRRLAEQREQQAREREEAKSNKLNPDIEPAADEPKHSEEPVEGPPKSTAASLAFKPKPISKHADNDEHAYIDDDEDNDNEDEEMKEPDE